MQTPDTDWLTVGGAAHELSVCEQTIRRWMRRGLLRGVRTTGGLRLFLRVDVERARARKRRA